MKLLSIHGRSLQLLNGSCRWDSINPITAKEGKEFFTLVQELGHLLW